MKGYFAKKKHKRTIREREEQLVGKYYDDLQSRPGHVPDKKDVFDKQGVYDRIMSRINREVPELNRTSAGWRVAASVVLLLGTGVFIYQYAGKIKPASPEHKIVAVRGETAELTLDDGTNVWLNAGSELIYPDSFRDSVREVTLKGEAYFEVKQDSKRPFLIHSGDITTRVLGTSFNIKAYPEEDNIAVSVITGKVEVAAKTDQNTEMTSSVLLIPNQQALYRKTSRSLVHLKHRGSPDESIAWKSGRMVYKNKTLSEITGDVERKYDVKISVPEHLDTCLVSVDFDGEPLDFILEVLAELVGGQVKSEGSVYQLEGSGC